MSDEPRTSAALDELPTNGVVAILCLSEMKFSKGFGGGRSILSTIYIYIYISLGFRCVENKKDIYSMISLNFLYLYFNAIHFNIIVLYKFLEKPIRNDACDVDSSATCYYYIADLL